LAAAARYGGCRKGGARNGNKGDRVTESRAATATRAPTFDPGRRDRRPPGPGNTLRPARRASQEEKECADTTLGSSRQPANTGHACARYKTRF
jgi:hypothetical protein